MPFESKAQRRWMFATHPAMAHRWARHTPKGRLPERKKSTKRGNDMTLQESVVDAGEVLAAVLAAGDRLHADHQVTRQKCASVIPRLVEDLTAGKFIEPHEKAAVAAALADPVKALEVMVNLVAEARERDQVKTAGSGDQRLGHSVGAGNTPHTGFVGSRSDGDRASDRAFMSGLFGTV